MNVVRMKTLTEKPKTIWKANLGGQKLFLTCPYKEVLIEGTRGGGKTDVLLMDFVQHVGKGYGSEWRGILFRKTFPELKDIKAKSLKFFSNAFPDAKFNAAEYKWSFPQGEQLFFSYMRVPEDYWGYHGQEWPWIAWEELPNWKDNTCYELMKSCNRSTGIDLPRRYVSNANPFGIGHGWVKSYFIDPALPMVPIVDEYGTRIRIRSFWWENKQLVENDPEYIKILESIKDPNLKKAWLWGDWDIVAGGALTDVWNEQKHFIQPFEIPHTWRIDRAFDWGSSKPFSVGWWAESDGTEAEIRPGVKRSFPAGTLFRIAEWYGCKKGETNVGLKMLSSEIAREIKKIEANWDFEVKAGPADSSIFDAEDGQSIADKMKLATNIKWRKADKRPGSRVSGLEKMREMLFAAQQFPMEDPGLFIFNTCLHWKRTVPVLPRDEKKMDDVDTDAEDHQYDETRYRITDKRLKGGEVAYTGT